MGFGLACAPVRCAHPSFRVHCHPPPRPSQLRCFLFDPQKYLHSIKLGTPTSRAFFYPLDHRGYEIGSPRLSFYFYFSFSFYSSLLILLFLSLLILFVGAILLLFFFLFWSIWAQIHVYTGAIIRPNYFFLFFFINIMYPAPPIAASMILTALY